MVGLLDKVRKKVVASVYKKEEELKPDIEIDNKIALGVLLWAVAEADNKFLPEEEEKIKDILNNYLKISVQDMPIVLNTIEIANIERIDLHKFTKEAGHDLPYDVKKEIVVDLFRVACADGDLDHAEHETIRKISNLLGIDHKDFINSKLSVKKACGLEETI